MLFAFISSILSYLLILYVYNLISSYHGIVLDLDFVEAKKEIGEYSYRKKEVITRKKRINLSYILTILLGFLSAGYFVPIFFSLNPIIIESKRIGKSRWKEVSYEEKTKIIFIGSLIIWVIFSIIKYLGNIAVILEGIINYMFKFLMYYTISSVIPLCLVLIPIVSKKMGYIFDKISIGDNFIYSKKPFLMASTITILFLPFLALFLHPILLIILSLITYSIIWLRKTAEAS